MRTSNAAIMQPVKFKYQLLAQYYNCLKSVLCCLFKPVFFHHAVLYTSQNLTLRPGYFDQEDELAFIGNFLFIPVTQLVKFSGFSPTPHAHTRARTHTSLSLSLSVLLASKYLAYKLNLSLSPAGSQSCRVIVNA